MSVPRKFNHEAAVIMRADGMSLMAIARALGVSPSAVDRATNPERAKQMAEQAAAHLRRKRRPCKGCGNVLVWTHGRGRTGYCRTCIGDQRRTYVHGTNAMIKRGCKCDVCMSYQRELRAEHRRRNRVPCSGGCGRMVDPPGKVLGKLPECRSCWHERRRVERRAKARKA